jgi:hypothetical protein
MSALCARPCCDWNRSSCRMSCMSWLAYCCLPREAGQSHNQRSTIAKKSQNGNHSEANGPEKKHAHRNSGSSWTARSTIRLSNFFFVSLSANLCRSRYWRTAPQSGHLMSSHCFCSSPNFTVACKQLRHVVGKCVHSSVTGDWGNAIHLLWSLQTTHSILILAVTCDVEM